ncbi:MAG: hypothetical protein M1837_004285 [Sclerophora amabilis]|nr:MAG: hypothetical protein M1837_004285 [Sclerophora amabilis]
MFSEYASRFLAQSQSRISSFRQDNPNDTSRHPQDRQRRLNVGPSRFPTSRSHLQRPSAGQGYQSTASHFSQFPFASRTSAAQAPLFYSATDEFREDDDEVEHEREVADLYALQRSRRHFGASQLEESSEADDDGSKGSDFYGAGDNDGRSVDDRGPGRGGGIKSSWRGGKVGDRRKGKPVGTLQESPTDEEEQSEGSSKGKGRLVDIGLESITRGGSEPLGDDEAHSPDDTAISPDDDPPPFQQFRRPPSQPHTQRSKHTSFIPTETALEDAYTRPRPPSSDSSSVPPTITYPTTEPPRHDSFFASLFLISLASVFATFVLVFLHTSAPSGKHPLGDTIYTTLHSSFFLLAVDTVVAVIVSLLWLSLLRNFVRPLVYSILIGAPIILISFSIYPFVSSFKDPYHGSSLQDKTMRWLSLVPAIAAVLWAYTIFRGRHSFNKAIGILEFTVRVLAANPALLALGFGTLVGVIAWTWIWMGMFTRIFLGGHLSTSKNLFIIDAGSWWLGVWFVLMYLWTLAVGSGVQRATTAATVSQWYFHRLAVPAPSSREVVLASLSHALTTLFGTICLATLLSLMIRVPLLLLPRRAVGCVTLFTYSLMPTSVVALTNPLSLTYAAIHSQPLNASARALGQMSFLTPSSPTTTLHPRTFNSRNRNTAPLLPYRLAKLLLYATRFIMSLALGFGGWVSTARMLVVEGAGVRGSLYAYVVGLIAGAIGWGVLGAMEGILGGILDAVVICWGSEGRQGSGGGYCLEANWLFGEGPQV